MPEEKRLKPMREVLRSQRFQKEISLLLIIFAVVQFVACGFLLMDGTSQPGVLETVMAGFAGSVISLVLAIFIRNGSVTALIIAGVLFALDLLAALFGPSWETARGVLLLRGLLILVLIQFIQRERKAVSSEVRN